MHNRLADNWQPLLAIADAAGGEWPERAHQASVAARAGDDEQSTKVRLLGDIKAVFEEKAADRLASVDLVEALVAMEDRQWAEWRGKPITQTGVARLLKPFGISPVKRSYQFFQFEDAFARYLPQ